MIHANYMHNMTSDTTISASTWSNRSGRESKLTLLWTSRSWWSTKISKIMEFRNTDQNKAKPNKKTSRKTWHDATQAKPHRLSYSTNALHFWVIFNMTRILLWWSLLKSNYREEETVAFNCCMVELGGVLNLRSGTVLSPSLIKNHCLGKTKTKAELNG